MRAQVWCDWGLDDDKLFYVEGETKEELKSKAAEEVKKISGYEIDEWILEEDENTSYWFIGNQDIIVSLEIVSANYGRQQE